MSAEDIAMLALNGLDPNVLDDFEVNYHCGCSRERTERILYSLGKKELNELSEDEITEVKCHFCGKAYRFTRDEIVSLVEKKNS